MTTIWYPHIVIRCTQLLYVLPTTGSKDGEINYVQCVLVLGHSGPCRQ